MFVFHHRLKNPFSFFFFHLFWLEIPATQVYVNGLWQRDICFEFLINPFLTNTAGVFRVLLNCLVIYRVDLPFVVSNNGGISFVELHKASLIYERGSVAFKMKSNHCLVYVQSFFNCFAFFEFEVTIGKISVQNIFILLQKITKGDC